MCIFCYNVPYMKWTMSLESVEHINTNIYQVMNMRLDKCYYEKELDINIDTKFEYFILNS